MVYKLFYQKINKFNIIKKYQTNIKYVATIYTIWECLRLLLIFQRRIWWSGWTTQQNPKGNQWLGEIRQDGETLSIPTFHDCGRSSRKYHGNDIEQSNINPQELLDDAFAGDEELQEAEVLARNRWPQDGLGVSKHNLKILLKKMNLLCWRVKTLQMLIIDYSMKLASPLHTTSR